MLRVNTLSGFGRILPSGGGGGFTPNDIGSVWAWFEADSYAQADASSISTDWQDQSPNNRDATVTGSNLTYQTNELNGQPIIQSTGSSRFNLPSMNALTAGEAYIVQKMTSITTSGGHNLGGNGLMSHYPFSGDNIYDSFGATVRKDSIVTNATLTSWHCTYYWSASSDWAMFQNTSGTAIHSTSSNTVQFNNTPYFLYNGTQYMEAHIAAVYLFSAKLSTDDRNSMKAYITDKYGLSFA